MFAFGFFSFLKSSEKTQASYPPIYYSFDKDAKEIINVYVNVSNDKYAHFRIIHEVETNKYKNLWRIIDSYMCSYEAGAMNRLYPVLTSGENEFVWRSAREGVEEFTGGYHGNERIDLEPDCGVTFYADNQVVSLSSSIPLTACNSFYYLQKSTMHETGTGGLIGTPGYVEIPGNPLECYHEKKTVFENGGYDCYNKLVWADNCSVIKLSYHGIFCVTKDVAKEGSNQSGNSVVFDDDGSFELKSDSPKIVMWNDDLGIEVTCDASFLQPVRGYLVNSSVWDSSTYHKYYCAMNNNWTTRARYNEVWETTSSIKFRIKE